MRTRRNAFRAIGNGVLMLVAFASPTRAPAADRHWAAPGGGNFGVAGNWLEGVVPGVLDRAIFDLNVAPYDISFSQSFTNSKLAVTHDDVTFNLAVQSYTATDSLVVGGSFPSPFVPPANGVLTLSGALGHFNTVGAAIGGAGFVTVGSGTVRVVSGTTWTNTGVLTVGNRVHGSVIALDGGQIVSSSGVIGLGATGGALVRDPQSSWINSSTLDVGGNQDGSLIVGGGGLVQNTDGAIGVAAGVTGEVGVFQHDSSWVNTHALTVGVFGEGTLLILDGGVVSTNATNSQNVIGDQSGSSGNVRLEDLGSQLFNNGARDLYIGRMGSGTLLLLFGGSVHNGGNAFIAQHPFGTGSVGVHGVGGLEVSRWENGGSVFVGGGATAAGGTGTLEVGTFAELLINASSKLKIWPPGTVTLNGGLIETGTLEIAGGPFVWNSGTLHILSPFTVGPGGAFGSDLSIGSNQTLHASTVNVGPTGFGTLHVSSTGQVESDLALAVGIDGNGTVDVTGGGSLSSYGAILGDDPGFSGSVTLDGAGSHWELPFVGSAPDLVTLGRAGTGTLQLSNGATLLNEYADVMLGQHSNGSGSVTVSGGGAQLDTSLRPMTVGNAGNGSVNVLSGGTLTANAFLGDGAGGVGTAIVDGSGSTWNAPVLTLGGLGQGALTISNGGSVLSSQPAIGNQAGSLGSAVVTGAGSLWDCNLDLIVGAAGNGSLTVQAGGSTSQDNTRIGDEVNGAGSVTVTGTSSHIASAQQVSVGFDGTGTLLIESGGAIDCSRATIGRRDGSSGVAAVTGPGSTWDISQNLDVGGGVSGTLTVANGAAVSVGDTLTVRDTGTVILPSGTLSAALVNITGGTLTGVGPVTGAVSNSGRVAPGNSPGVLTVNGSFTQASAGRLEVELAGDASGQFDELHVSGAATLAGAISVILMGGFVPHNGDEFQIITAGSVSGTFLNVILTNFPPGASVELLYAAQSVTLRFHGLAGDLNGDFSVDLADYAQFRPCLSGPGGGILSGCDAADLDEDADVDLRDAGILFRLFTEP